MFTVDPVYAQDQGVPLLVYETGRKAYRRVLENALSGWYQEVGIQHSPRSPGGPQVEPVDLSAQHT